MLFLGLFVYWALGVFFASWADLQAHDELTVGNLISNILFFWMLMPIAFFITVAGSNILQRVVMTRKGK